MAKSFTLYSQAGTLLVLFLSLEREENGEGIQNCKWGNQGNLGRLKLYLKDNISLD